MLTKAYIPYRGYYSTPFARWQGTLAGQNAIVLGANTAKRFFQCRNWDAHMFDYVIVGGTVYQPKWFYSGPWVAAMMGADKTPGVFISQACSTGTFCLYEAGMGLETGLFDNCWCLMADRMSNGPHAVWADPNGPGGQPYKEDWVMDNFATDPWAGAAMVQTADNVANEVGITKEQCDALVLRRQEQYNDSLANDRAFQKRYMFGAEVPLSKKKTIMLDADEGVFVSTKEGLAGLKPLNPGGVHTFGGQTHPCDGNAGLCVTTREKAKELSADGKVEIQIVSYGYARAKKAFMAAAVAPSAQMALDRAGLKVKDIGAIKTHNPFAANDLAMAQTLGCDLNSMNNYGCSLIYGHPQAPTAARAIIEGIEELVIKGGGYLLFSGCAAGDTGASIILKVS
jgi:acetyl-CoA acetyltransferase